MGRLLQIWRQLVPAAHRERSGAEHDESEHGGVGQTAADREGRGRTQDGRSSPSTKRRARGRSQERGRESSLRAQSSSPSLENQSGLADHQSHVESRREPYPVPKPYSAMSASQEVEVEWELYPSKTAAEIYYGDHSSSEVEAHLPRRYETGGHSSAETPSFDEEGIKDPMDRSSGHDQISSLSTPSTFSHATYSGSDVPHASTGNSDPYASSGQRDRVSSLEQFSLGDGPLSDDRASHLPETEMVGAIEPPSGEPVERESAQRARVWSRQAYQTSSGGLRAQQTPLSPIFQWSRGPEGRGSLSLALLPVVVPNVRSLAPLEREAIDYLRECEPSPERDRDLWDRYERYLSLTPNHMDMWSEFGDFMIEVRGLEVASDRIKSALGTVQDDTPLLILLTRMSCRMCDYMIASHYVNRAVRLQPNNLEVLTLLRDVQRENKLFDSASDTEALIHNLQRGILQDSDGSTSGSDHGQLS